MSVAARAPGLYRAPLVKDFEVWLRKQRARVSPKPKLGERLAYIANHRDGRQVFLTDGRVEMDTNIVENAIRPLVLNRKNALFAGHDEVGAVWARIASLVETAKMNRIDPTRTSGPPSKRSLPAIRPPISMR